MRKLILIAALCLSTSVIADSVKISNGNISVRSNGVTENYGKVRNVKERNGTVEIYSSRNYSSPAVTINKNGSYSTQKSNNSRVDKCRYNCDVEMEEDE